jgi:hypothetical protein
MMPRSLWLGLCGWGLLLGAAQAQRDPTRPPDAALPPASAADSARTAASGIPAADTDALPAPLRHRMVVDGKPYLVERGWLRGVGDRLGDARIERLTEREVWLRDANGLRKLPLYPQIDLHPAAEPASAAKRLAPARQRARPLTALATKDTTP